MRFGILRNIAGNIEALTDADRHLDRLGVDVKVCLGQIVGMYPYVDDCVEFLISRGYFALRRHEDDEFVESCSFVGWSTTYLIHAIRFARSRVSTASVEYLRTLPVRHVIGDVAFESRASVRQGLIQDADQVAAAFAMWNHRTVFHAAKFDPYVWREDLSGEILPEGRTELPTGGRLLISTGGVGSYYQGSLNTKQPVAMVFDEEARAVVLVRPMCNLGKILDRLRGSGYPPDALDFLNRREYEAWRT